MIFSRAVQQAPRTPSKTQFAVDPQIPGCISYGVHCRVDVAESGIPPAAGARVILFAANIFPGASEQSHDLPQTAPAIEVRVGPRMIVYLLAIEHRRAVGLPDCSLNLLVRPA
jgi:hypothetical protein